MSDALTPDYPEDGAHGLYAHRCRKCNASFRGHKRRVLCKFCHDSKSKAEAITPDAAPTAPPQTEPAEGVPFRTMNAEEAYLRAELATTEKERDVLQDEARRQLARASQAEVDRDTERLARVAAEAQCEKLREAASYALRGNDPDEDWDVIAGKLQDALTAQPADALAELLEAHTEATLRAYADPGAFTPRADNYTEPMDSWEKRAAKIATRRITGGAR